MGDYRIGYQDSYIGGKVVARGRRDCEQRYEAIRSALEARGFGPGSRVLDLGALTGYFGFRLADDLGVDVTAIDESPILADHAKRNGNDRVRVHTFRFTLADVKTFAPYDAVLALSLLHWFPAWAGLYRTLRALSDWLVLEIPHPGEGPSPLLPALDELVRAEAGSELLVEVPGYATELLRPTFVVPGGPAEGTPATIVDGYGDATKNLSPEAVPDHPSIHDLEPVLGYRPHAGTLNLRSSTRPTSSSPIEYRDTRGRLYELVPIRVGGVAGHELRGPSFGPRYGGHSDVLEVVAPVHLRTALGVSSGDVVEWSDR